MKWPAYAGWAAFLLVMASSLRVPSPILWNDSPAFVQAALLSLQAGVPTTVAGRDFGYPAILATVFALKGDLATVVLLQQMAWTAAMLFVAATATRIAGTWIGLSVAVLLATYPGMLIFRHIIMAEAFYSALLAASACLVVRAIGNGSGHRVRWLVWATLLSAGAACIKSSGLACFGLIALVTLCLSYRKSRSALRWATLSIVVGATLVGGGFALRASSADSYSRAFAQKTIFCNHLNIFLASDVAKRRLSELLGEESRQFVALAEADYRSQAQAWPTLGFYGDACMFDRELDRAIDSGTSGDPGQLSATYRMLVVTAIADQPIAYVRKVANQFRYGLMMSWPPMGDSAGISGVPGATAEVAAMVAQSGRPVEGWLTEAAVIAGWPMSPRGRMADYFYRAVSLLIALTVAAVPLAWLYRARFDRTRLVQLTFVSALWLAHIAIPALSHTLDIWRYIASAAPVGALIITLGAALLRSTMRRDVQWSAPA